MRDIQNHDLSKRAERLAESATSGWTPSKRYGFTLALCMGASALVTAGFVWMSDDGMTSGAISSKLPSLRPADLAGAPVNVLLASAPPADFDGDGLVDAQEEVLGLSPAFFDTDGDGFGDGEELARQTDPADDLSFPMSDGICVSLTARGADDRLRLVIAVHEPAGEIGQSKIRIGALTRFGAVSVPIDRFIGLSDVTTAPGTNGSLTTMVDIPIHPAFIHASGTATFFIAGGHQADVAFGAAAKIDVVSTDGILMLMRPLASSFQTLQGGFQGGGSIRQPIPQSPASSLPMSWIPGAICFQTTATVGANGAVVLKQVIEADCLQGWDSFCASDCSSSVGSTFETIDPSALIGG